MENYTVVILILAIMIGLSAVADRIRLPYPILLIAAGIAAGFVPAIPDIEINPEVIFLIFLPPLLYDAAFNTSFEDFRTHINTISGLAIGLVFLTTSGIAVVAHYLIPGMTWPLSFVLGSILSATDAVAAMGITKGLGLPKKTVTILEGESLVNDASALVAYRFAVAAVTGAAFVFWRASLQFLGLMAGGYAVGWLAGALLRFILWRVRDNLLVVISFMMLMPFVTYLLAETVHVSGVIAVVTLGLFIARLSKQNFPENVKAQSKSIWSIIIFLLNGLIFILIGLQFPYVLKSIPKDQVWPDLLYALLITLVALVVRSGRVYFQRINLNRAFRYQTERPQQPRRRKISADALLDYPSSLIISWSGMRGIVSLAVAIGLPQTLENGQPFPARNTIIFISVAVVLFTLLGQGLMLPWLVKRLQKKDVRIAASTGE